MAAAQVLWGFANPRRLESCGSVPAQAGTSGEGKTEHGWCFRNESSFRRTGRHAAGARPVPRPPCAVGGAGARRPARRRRAGRRPDRGLVRHPYPRRHRLRCHRLQQLHRPPHTHAPPPPFSPTTTSRTAALATPSSRSSWMSTEISCSLSTPTTPPRPTPSPSWSAAPPSSSPTPQPSTPA